MNDLAACIEALQQEVVAEKMSLDIMAETAFLQDDQPLAEILAEQASDIERVIDNLSSLGELPATLHCVCPSANPSPEERGMHKVYLICIRMLALAELQADEPQSLLLTETLHRVKTLYQLSIEAEIAA